MKKLKTTIAIITAMTMLTACNSKPEENPNPSSESQTSASVTETPPVTYEIPAETTLPEFPETPAVDWLKAVNPPPALTVAPDEDFQYSYDVNLNGVISWIPEKIVTRRPKRPKIREKRLT